MLFLTFAKWYKGSAYAGSACHGMGRDSLMGLLTPGWSWMLKALSVFDMSCVVHCNLPVGHYKLQMPSALQTVTGATRHDAANQVLLFVA